jgi:hypothetical protein
MEPEMALEILAESSMAVSYGAFLLSIALTKKQRHNPDQNKES